MAQPLTDLATGRQSSQSFTRVGIKPVVISLARPRFAGVKLNRLQKTGIVSLLRSLGLPTMASGRTFWQDHSKDELSYLLHDAREIYRQRIKLVAPRKASDCDRKASELNSLFTEIERRFNCHINPLSVTEEYTRMVERQRGRTVNGQALAKRTSRQSDQYSRVCKLPGCGQPFVTHLTRKVFCCFKHKKRNGDIALASRRKDARRLAKTLAPSGI